MADDWGWKGRINEIFLIAQVYMKMALAPVFQGCGRNFCFFCLHGWWGMRYCLFELRFLPLAAGFGCCGTAGGRERDTCTERESPIPEAFGIVMI